MSLNPKQVEELFAVLKVRFERNIERHPGINWEDIVDRLKANPEKLIALHYMEESCGEPDVLAYEQESDCYHFYDCSPESPKGRRSLCYDQEVRIHRKKYPPESSALEQATSWNASLLSEEQYHYLQQHGEFDLKTSSWIQTPESIRKLGGAIFGDRRFGRVFIYHNGADSYYSSRGFRLILKV
ncbi:MAG: DUF4256 domain-containing protein [Bacteroidota bacterium]